MVTPAREELTRYFEEYAGTARRALADIAARHPVGGSLTHVQRACLEEAVEWLESQPTFRELVEATRDTFQDGKHHSSGSFEWWASSIGHFFRRSGFYLDCYEGGAPDYTELLRVYEQAFLARKVEVTYLLPLEWVYFVELREGVLYPRREPLDCGTFTLRCYSREELECLSGNRINRVFYPYAVWNTERLAWYWYITIKGRKPIIGIGEILFDFTGLDYVQRKLAPNWLAAFQVPLYRLVLHDWLPEAFRHHRELHKVWPKELEGFSWPAIGIRYSLERLIRNEQYLGAVPWHGFRVPFRLVCDGNLIHSPPTAPNTSVLELEPRVGPGGEEVMCPADWLRFELDRKATAELERLMRKELYIIDTPLLEAWPFFRIALEYLLKAFLTDPYWAPAEQILWHVTALEALLGRQEDDKLVKAIARRLGRLLGSNSRERERVDRHFRMLYQVRSDLVHGNPWKNYSTLYLYLARNLARQTCLRYVELATSCIQEGRPLPDREQIIAALNEERFEELLGKKPRASG